MAYIDFPNSEKGLKERKAFYLSPDGITLIASWRREGIPLEEIALKYIGASETTLWRWTKQSPELAQALKVSKDTVNAAVEESLLKRALGYQYDEVTEELVEGQMRVTKIVRKDVPPDVKACLSWLYSQRSDRWRALQAPLDTTDKDIADIRNVLVSIANTSEDIIEVEAHEEKPDSVVDI